MSKDDLQRIKKMYAEALSLQKAGDDQRAANIYGQIININANIAEVHFQLTRLFLKHDKLEEALRHIKAATTLKPGEKDVWHLRHEVTKALSDRDVTRTFTEEIENAPLEKSVKKALKAAVAFRKRNQVNILGVGRDDVERVARAINSGRVKEAEAQARQLIRIHPNEAILRDYLAVALASQQRFEAAEAAFLEGVRVAPDFAQLRTNYARLLDTMGRPEATLAQCNLALRAAPGNKDALFLRGLAFQKMKQNKLAMDDFRRVLAVDPDHQKARLSLAALLVIAREYTEAEEVTRESIRRGDKSALVYLNLGSVLQELNQPREALEAFHTAVEKDPELSRAHARVGELQQTLGNFEEAEAAFDRAIELDPDSGGYYRVYLTGKKISADDPIVAEMDKRFRNPTLAADNRANFGFALAKVMEDNKIYDRVFEYLHPANALIRSENPVDGQYRREGNARLLAALDTIDWKNAPQNTECDYAPIFVSGVPRSGTTLVEQIIAAHSEITSTGELGVANKRTVEVLGSDGKTIRPASTLTQDDLKAIADHYRAYVERLYPGSGRITDKSIQTFSYLGVLKCAMPKSRFVIVRRDPRDNLLSMYKNVFPEGTHLYAYNLTDLAEYQKMFVQTVDFWRERVPEWFYEIQYEDLVANPEEEARKLIAACGLEWEDACLSFHESKQRVRTLSVYQVRQPIYKSSAKSWERYADDLKELFEALGPEYTHAAE